MPRYINDDLDESVELPYSTSTSSRPKQNQSEKNHYFYDNDDNTFSSDNYSKSKRRNWIYLGVALLVFLIIAAAVTVPLVLKQSNSKNKSASQEASNPNQPFAVPFAVPFATPAPNFVQTEAPVTSPSAPYSSPVSSPSAADPVVTTSTSAPAPVVAPVAAPVVAPNVPPTPLPVASDTTQAPASPPFTSNLYNLLQPLLLQGNEFDDPTSYQSQALQFIETILSSSLPSNDQAIIAYFALACLYYATYSRDNSLVTSPDPWLSSQNWVTDSDYCTWYGVTCDGDQNVLTLKLPNNRLSGFFAPEIQFLSGSLQEIDLFNNLYLLAEGDAGNAWIGQMTNLQKLFLGSTSFEYDGIPPYTANLPLLQELDFSFTLYTQGPIRDEAFLNNPLLTYVDIGNNEYTSTIPASITQHPSIQYLYIDNVIFDGVEQTLEFLVGMPSLIETWNDYTEFAASLPAALSSSSTLKSLSLTFCSLTGTLPPEWGSLSNTLDRLWLQQNLLTGTIPSAWENLVRLQYLYLQGNQLGGTVPLCTIRTDGLLTELGVDCDQDNPYLVNCSCCTCCGATECGDFL